MHKKIPAILLIFFIVVLIASGAVIFGLSFLDFNTVKNYLDSRATDGDVESFTAGYFNELMPKYRIGGVILFVLGVAVLCFHRLLLNVTTGLFQDVKNYLRYSVSRVRYFIRTENRFHLGVFFLVIIVGIWIRFIHLMQPVFYDEAFTYIIYANKPVFVLMSYYTYPNNHLFHTLLVHFCNEVFGIAPWSLRMPVFVCGILLLPVTYGFARKFFDKQTGLLSMALVAASNELIIYSTYARGYIIVTLFFLVIFILARSVIRSKSRAALVLIIVFSALGFYTVPTFLYAFGIVVCWMMWQNYRLKKMMIGPIVAGCVLTVVLTIILYSPIILFSGLDSIISNDYVVSDHSLLISETNRLVEELVPSWTYNLPLMGCVLITIGILVSLSFETARLLFVMSLSVLSAIFIFNGIVPPGRTLLFLLPLIAVLSSVGIVALIQKTWFAFVSYLVPAISLVALVMMLLQIEHAGLMPLEEAEDNEKITFWLKSNMKSTDKLIADFASDYPLEYYMRLHNVPVNNLRGPIDSIGRYLIIVNNAGGQTIYEVVEHTMPEKKHSSSQAKLLKQFEHTDIYELK